MSLSSRALRSAIVATLACSSTTAFASGFALLEQSASRIGTAFAGTAAAADDATTLFYNPAGMGALKQSEVSLVATGIDVGSQFGNDGSVAAFSQPLGVNGGDAGGGNFVPSAYWAMPLNESFAVGFGVNAPFGLKLEYDADWVGRFQALKSEITTYNFNPALSWRINQVVTLGVGLDYQKLQAELTNSVNYSAVVAQGAQQLLQAGQLTNAQFLGVVGASGNLSGLARVRGDDSQWGYNVGMLFELPSQTTIGLSYRSSLQYKVKGSASFVPPVAGNPIASAIIAGAGQTALANGPASVELELPDSAILSLEHSFGTDFEVLADIAWTGWSSVRELRVVRDSGVTLSDTPERWKDTWRYALGGVYSINDSWKLRAGIAYDEAPVPDSTRTARLPDADRKWVAIGTQWSVTPQMVIDAGYAHLFSDDSRISQSAGSIPANALLAGRQATSVDIVSVQASYKW